MKSMLFPLAAVLASLLPAPASAADTGSAAIAAIGRINGMALACQQDLAWRRNFSEKRDATALQFSTR